MPCALAAVTMAGAQDIEALRKGVLAAGSEVRYPAFLGTLSDLAEDGELSGGRIAIDGGGGPGIDLRLLAVPWRRDFDVGAEGLRLRAEASAGYASARIDAPDLWNGLLPGQETRVVSRYEAAGAELGVGLSLDLDGAWILQPVVHGSLHYVSNKTDYFGAGAGFTRSITDGILFNWDGIYGAYGVSTALRQADWAWGEVELRPLLRFDLRRNESVDVSDPVLRGGSTVQWLTGRLDASGPTGWAIGESPVRWSTSVGYRRLLGGTADLFGFDDYFEVGAGLGVESAALPLVSGLDIDVVLIVGEDVLGWNAGVSVDF